MLIQPMPYGGEAPNYFGTGADGDVTISSNTNLSTTTGADDTGVVVRHYNSLAINAGYALTAANRARAMLIYVKGDCTISGTLSMSRRGAAAAPSGGCNIFRIPFAGGGGSAGDPFAQFPDEKQKGTTGTKKYGPGQVGAAGGAGGTTGNGNAGADGTGGNCGGGGAGGSGTGDNHMTNMGKSGGKGTAFSGGSGGGGGGMDYNIVAYATAGSDHGGPGGNGHSSSDGYGRGGGGGAGNPGGAAGTSAVNGQPGTNGTGGVIFLVVGGNLVIGSSGRIEANGANGGNGADTGSYQFGAGGGGGSGGGSITALYGGTLTNNGTVEAKGGNGGAGGWTNGAWGPNLYGGTGGKGGDGSVVVERIKAA